MTVLLSRLVEDQPVEEIEEPVVAKGNDDEDEQPCPTCGGTGEVGRTGEEGPCGTCGGTGTW